MLDESHSICSDPVHTKALDDPFPDPMRGPLSGFGVREYQESEAIWRNAEAFIETADNDLLHFVGPNHELINNDAMEALNRIE
jgi:hypothetical protein